MFQTFSSLSDPGAVAERVAAVRALMAKAKIDCLLVPRSDEHQGEYVPACAERLRWVSGFSGSAGIAAITRKAAVLFTDGRYSVQAKAETDTSAFEVSMLPRWRLSEWLGDHIVKGQTIGFDPWLHTAGEIARLKAALTPKGIRLKPTARNLIDKAWGRQRPPPPSAPVVPQPVEFTGKSATEKIADLQKQLKADGQSAVVLTLPDSICWLLNIRGGDVEHNPVALCFAIVPVSGKAELYIDTAKIGRDAKAHLAAVAKILPKAKLGERIAALKAQGKRVRIDVDTAAHWFAAAIGPASLTKGADPCILPKAIKTGAEIEGARGAHVRDGVAVARYLAWLDDWASDGTLDEITAVQKLEEFRRDTNLLREISFATISGSGPNGAIVHYRVTEKTNRKLTPGELFLVDSGAQYQDGTTDITRTIAIGTPSDDMKRHFTAVLKGHIAIATARFPNGTRGIDLDPFARRALWDIGADFDHGTGHGIGSYLSVHEGPQSISRAGMAVLQPGMLVSNEPGYYREGVYGIRIENVVLVKPAEVPPGGDRAMMAFETLTLVPIDRRLIDRTMLTASEISWLDAYHARVREVLSPKLDGSARRWLEQATAPI